MKRIREIDIMRTAAMLMMVTYHVLYDLDNFAGLEIRYNKLPLSLIGRFAALAFIFLSGISSGFSSNPSKRGISIFACGMVITLVTFAGFKDSFVVFGILHLLGACMMLADLMKRASTWILLLMVPISVAIGYYFNTITVKTKLLLPLGLVYSEFTSLDYYPIFPYISVFMAGVIYYRIFYKDKKSIFNLEAKNDIIEKLSRKSLLIYLVHQPIIVGIIYIVVLLIR